MVTYTFLPSWLTDTAKGRDPTLMFVNKALVAKLISDTLLEPKLGIYAKSPEVIPVTDKVAVKGIFPLFNALKLAILPVPDDANPMDGKLFTQL